MDRFQRRHHVTVAYNAVAGLPDAIVLRVKLYGLRMRCPSELRTTFSLPSAVMRRERCTSDEATYDDHTQRVRAYNVMKYARRGRRMQHAHDATLRRARVTILPMRSL